MTTTARAMGSGSARVTFREIFDSELAFVCRALRRLGVAEADIGDIAQDLFLAVHARLDDYDPSRPLRTWLYAFCLRYASNYRKLARHRGISSSDVRETGDCHGDVLLARDLVLRALDKLDDDRRTVLVLHDMEGLPAPEIAALTACALNTVYSHLRLARVDFRQAVDALETGAQK